MTTPSIQVDDLAAEQPRLRESVTLPGSLRYDEQRVGFNRTVTSYPAAVVSVNGAADVLSAVRFAAKRDLPVAVQATGHGVSVPADNALLLDTSGLRGVRIDPEERTARVEAGVSWGRVAHEAAPFGLAPLVGSSPSVGAVGYTLGGGLGPLGRSFGYCADHVRGFDLVTADGQFRTVSPRQHPDLFWGLRGGKGNFGVVTSMEIDLFPVSRLYGGGLFLPGDSAEELLHTWRDWTRTVPEQMQSGLALIRFPDLEAIPEPLRGRLVGHVRIAYNGSAEEGERLVRPLREVRQPLMDTVTDMPFTEAGTINQDPTEPGPYHERSARLDDLSDTAIATLLDLIGPGVDCPLLVVELRHLGGALARQPRHPNAVPFREAGYTLFTASPSVADQVAPTQKYQQQLVDAMTPWRVGGPMLSFISSGEVDVEDVYEAYEPDTYARLVELKNTYDPRNLFRVNHNIPPTGV